MLYHAALTQKDCDPEVCSIHDHTTDTEAKARELLIGIISCSLGIDRQAEIINEYLTEAHHEGMEEAAKVMEKHHSCVMDEGDEHDCGPRGAAAIRKKIKGDKNV